MTTIAPIDAGAGAHPRAQQQQRSTADFGGAVTHRDAVKEKLRVDPASLAQKKLRAPHLRSSDPPREDEGKGQYVDVEI
ncbi:MAG: hypothetical protein AB7T59_10320 [Hyphomonadaceae bacterium]